jgi:hypothetical protein
MTYDSSAWHVVLGTQEVLSDVIRHPEADRLRYAPWRLVGSCV